MASHRPPLDGLRVVELAGLAPAPFAGLLLADLGASVLRIDRPTTSVKPPALDQLTINKSSIVLNLKDHDSVAILRKLLAMVDVLIDPYRPGTLESLGLQPDALLSLNARLIIARLSGFRRDGPYKDMAGHDVNYLAVSGILSQLGRKDKPPYAPANIIADFAGGGLMCVMGILLALITRAHTGKGQIIESNMVDGSAYLGNFMRLARKTPLWDKPRGENILDGGCPWYDVYECSDGGFMAVGALEDRFYDALMKGLALPEDMRELRHDRTSWPELREAITLRFKEKTRSEWEEIFQDTDACCTPVLYQDELEKAEEVQWPPMVMSSASTRSWSTEETWNGKTLKLGHGGSDILERWMRWKEGRDFITTVDGLKIMDSPRL